MKWSNESPGNLIVAAAWIPAFIAAWLVVPGTVLHAQELEANGDDDEAAPAVADTAEVNLVAHRLPDGVGIDLDGSLDEGSWTDATPITDFTQQEPVEGASPSEPTEVRVLYDDDHLYIGAVVYDDPDGILAYQRERDAGLGTDDRFMWILDTFLDGRTGYFFEINAAGLMGDGIITGGGGGGGGPGGGGGAINKSWDGIWEAQTTRRPDGWAAEIRIPFRTLNFDPALDMWGINFQRTIRRRNEEIMWRGFLQNQSLFRPVYAGRLTNLSGLSQGLGLEAVPSAIMSWRNVPGDADATTFPRELSLDVNYSITSSLRASVSVNTDFAEVESDQRRVNLTRFPLFFPEQRDFFLEGSGVFSFAPRSNPNPFFSRRIGLTGGQQIPIEFGARMTGQAGAYELGFYQIRTGSDRFAPLDPTDPEVFVPREDFTVARVRRRLFEQSSIGAIYTRRSTGPDESGFSPDGRHTAGIDLQLATRSFLGDNNAELEAFVAWNSDPDAGVEPAPDPSTDPSEDPDFGALSSRGFRFNFPNDVWSGHLSYREFGDAYDPAVGFVNRNDFRRVEPRIGWSPRPASIDWIRQLQFGVQFRHLTGLRTGIVEERRWDFDVLGIDFESGDNVNLSTSRRYEYLDERFEISDGIFIESGRYRTTSYSLRGGTTGRRPVSLFGNFSVEEFWNGDRTRIGGRVTFRPNPGVSFSTNIEHNDIRLPQGDFTTDVYEIEGQWNPSPWVSATTQLQYDNVSEIVGLFSRVRWIITPGSEVYLVYTQNWRNDGPGIFGNRDLVTLSKGGSAKLNYTYRF